MSALETHRHKTEAGAQQLLWQLASALVRLLSTSQRTNQQKWWTDRECLMNRALYLKVMEYNLLSLNGIYPHKTQAIPHPTGSGKTQHYRAGVPGGRRGDAEVELTAGERGKQSSVK